MALTLSPAPWHQFLDANGQPYAGAQLFTYAAGTTTKLATYQDSAGSVPHANPITLDSAGRVTLYLQPAAYKFVVAPSIDSDPPTSPYRTQDNISAVPFTTVDLDVAAIAGEALAAQDAVYLSAGDGGCVAGHWYKADADQAYSSTTATLVGFVPADIAPGESGTVRLQGRMTGFVALSVGSIYYVSGTAGAITTTAPALVRAMGMADSLTTLIISAQASQTPPGMTSSGSTITGITFAATQVPSADANTLDDYEEGSWTPTIGGAGGQSGQSYHEQKGHYVKVGQLVSAWFQVQINVVGTITGAVVIKGLPFSPHATSPPAACALAWSSLPGTWVSVMGWLDSNAPGSLYVVGATVAATSNLTGFAAANLASGCQFRGMFQYRATT